MDCQLTGTIWTQECAQPLHTKLAFSQVSLPRSWWAPACEVCHTRRSFCTPSHRSYGCPYGFPTRLFGKVQHWVQGEHQMHTCWISKRKSANVLPGTFSPMTPKAVFSQSASYVSAFLWHPLAYLQNSKHGLASSSCLVHLFPLAPGPTTLTSTHPNTLCDLQSKLDCTSVGSHGVPPSLPALRLFLLPHCSKYPVTGTG